MKLQILVVGLAGLSLMAAAESNKKNNTPASSSKAASQGNTSGQASAQARKMPGRTSYQPLSSVATAPKSGQTPVSAGDVNADGHADVAAPAGSGNGQNGAVNSNNKDVSSGHASGKRQHSPMTVKKTTDASSPNLSQR